MEIAGSFVGGRLVIRNRGEMDKKGRDGGYPSNSPFFPLRTYISLCMEPPDILGLVYIRINLVHDFIPCGLEY